MKMATEDAHKHTADWKAFNRAPASRPATWHLKPPSQWNFAQRFLMVLDVLQDPPSTERPPVHAKTDVVPVFPVWRQHAFILPRLVAPLLVHRLFVELTGLTVHPVLAFFYYWVCMINFLRSHVAVVRRMGKKYGFYDGAHERDGVPNEDTGRVLFSLIATLTSRPLLALFYVYDRTEKPTFSWQAPLDVVAYTLVLDFFFYSYHRSMHEIPFLWRFHRKHHTTKHPNMLLSAYADHVQELFDMVVVPALAYVVVPMDFTTWWLATGTCLAHSSGLCPHIVSTCCSFFPFPGYLLYTESSGHCGVRVL